MQKRTGKLKTSGITLLFVMASFLAAGPQLRAQKSPPAAAAPVPPQIFTGSKVFIANAGSDGQSLKRIAKNGGPNMPYNTLYTGLSDWPQHTLVNAPADADLIFEIRLSTPVTDCQAGKTCPVPQLELAIYDAKTHVRLWTITEGIETAFIDSTFVKNTEPALVKLLEDVKGLVAQKP
jgi:hypothetical protein